MMFRHFEFKANDGTMIIDGRNLVMAVKRPTGESFGNKADLTDETEVMYIGNGGGGHEQQILLNPLFLKRL